MNRHSGGRAAGKNPTSQADDKSVKVKYISSPVMVEAKNPSQFKEIVQHFTGRTKNQTRFGRYSSPTTTTSTIISTNTDATTTASMDATSKFFAYGPSSTNSQLAIDGYSWEEIAEWNQNQ